MPVEKKASWARLKVGLLAIVAMFILAVVTFLITGKGNLFAGTAHVYTYLGDSAALTEGAPVTLNGINVGKVSKIQLSGSYDPARIVKIDMEIQQDMLSAIPVDSITSISAANVLGSKFINIKKGKSPVTIRPGAELPSLDVAEFEDVVKQGYAILTSLQGIIQRVDRIVGLVEAGKGSIGKLIVDEEVYNRVLAVVIEAQKIEQALNSDKGTLGKLLYDPALYSDVRATVGKLDGLLDSLQKGEGTAGKFLKDPAIYNETHLAITDVRRLLADLDAGKGTAGKLLKSDELHAQLLTTISKIDVMIDKLNAGQGTLGQLLVNQQLYDNLSGATRELHGLMKDFRSNPKKFLRIKLSLF
jgi:phospholipid/cholesterol/gamma-HCH transport system substrate-binding protein